MKRTLVMLMILGGAWTGTGRAAFTIDGSLSDWGVTPFAHWAPNPPAQYTETDNVNLYGASPYAEFYDMEAMYFQEDATNLYLAVVSSYPLDPGLGAGDLGIDLNHDMTIDSQGVVTGLEYAMHVGTGTLGQVVYHPVWSQTDFLQASPFEASGGTVVGTASVAIADYPDLESGTSILEAAIPRSILSGYDGLVGFHLTMWCGNDSINLYGHGTPVPAPGALGLGAVGVALIGWLRRRKAGIAGR